MFISQGRFMSTTEPFASLIEIAALEARRTRKNSPDPGAVERLKQLLSSPLGPLGKLDEKQRKTVGGRLEQIEAALNAVRPPWIKEYAAQALVELDWRAKKLRGAMARQLLRNHAESAAVLALLAEKLANSAAGNRLTLLKAILKDISGVIGPAADAPDKVEQAMLCLVMAANPSPTPKNFSDITLEIVPILRSMYPNKEHGLKFAAAKSSSQRIQPIFEKPYQALLSRRTWGALADDIFVVLWDQLWGRFQQPAKAEAPAADLEYSVARLYQIESTLRTYFSGVASVTEKIRLALAETHQSLAGEFSSLTSEQKILLQAIRNIAAQRNYTVVGKTNEIVDFDIRLHVLLDGDPARARKVRVVEPPVVRENAGGTPEVLAQGEVEECE